MNVPILGLLIGLLVAIATAAGGFVGFLLAIVLGGLGYIVGRYLEGGTQGVDSLLNRRGNG